MAKVAVLSRTITSQTLGFAQALKMQRHDVLLITSQDLALSPQELANDLDIEFPTLRCFKDWSAIEAIKNFPKLLTHGIEVWHFVFSDCDLDQPRGAHFAIAQMAKVVPHSVVAASFFDSVFNVPKWQITPFLKSNDIVTTADRESLMYLKRKNRLNNKSSLEVLPPPMASNHNNQNSSADIDTDIQRLAFARKPYLLVANERLPKFDWDYVLSQVNLIILGPRPQNLWIENFLQEQRSQPEKQLSDPLLLEQKISYAGKHLSENSLRYLLQNSQGLLTAFDDLSSVELMNWHRLCQKTQTPVLAHPRQVEALPGFCVHDRNGFVLESGIHSLKVLLSSNNELKLAQPQFELIRADISDSILNEISRMYARRLTSQNTHLHNNR